MTTIDSFLEDLGLIVVEGIRHFDDVDDFLEHHGIKGMKWGIRRERGPGGTVGGNPVNAKDPRKLSDSDLRAAVNRMQLERQFKELQGNTGNSTRTAKGVDFTKDFLASQGKKQLRRVADKAVDLAVEQAIKQVATRSGNKQIDEIAKRLKPKKK